MDRDRLSPEVAQYLESRGYKIEDISEPYTMTPEPCEYREDALFDPARVDKVIHALSCLKHTQGAWAGRPLVPDGWQAMVIAIVFGWVAPNSAGKLVRIVRTLYIDVPRKAGKTTIGSGLALYMAFADGEPGAQVLAVASSRDQAGNAYRPSKLIVEHSPLFKAAGIKARQAQIVSPDGSFFKAVASVGDSIHGSNPHAALIDELHVHKSPDVLEAVESGMGARDQPLSITITTADSGGNESVYAQRRGLVDSVANGTVQMPSLFGIVFASDEDDDPFAESTWKKANPGYGVSVSKEFMEQAAAKAKENPVEMASFLRLHLGRRTKQETKYIDMDHLARNAGLVVEDDLKGRDCYGGLDLASTSDLTALAWCFPDGQGGYDNLYRVFIPESALPALDKRTHHMASSWVERGFIKTTPGDVVDYEYVKGQILRDAEKFNVREIAFDQWNATQLSIDLQEQGLPMVKHAQSYAAYNPSLKELQRLLGQGTVEKPLFRWGGNPVFRWCVDNLAVVVSDAGDVKPTKAKSGDKIDVLVANLMGLSRAMNAEPVKRSFYEDLIVV